ncbi:MAG: hypothetical protein GY780_09205 [bacterium]|nr:hypothetical protein [bacterium]
MKFRIKVENHQTLLYPPLCPGCLASDPLGIDQFSHTTIVPGVPIHINQNQGWPLCLECLSWQKRKKDKAKRIKIRLALSVPLLAGAMYVLSGLFGIFTQIVVLYSFPLLFLMIGITLYRIPAICGHWALTNGSALGHDPIRIINMGKQAFKKGNFLLFDCYYKEYARSFILMNKDRANISVKPSIDD